ncbi:hypothetical protein DKX38_029344 [Salix brachista]|uniref:Uncharacterized protein n=1 Tax=Salix brachista TaxID=2182728 RepID=A0A5N5J1C5_9ROSI|nr:hypothetical protein DKX38_029344 [Salix brachista]
MSLNFGSSSSSFTLLALKKIKKMKCSCSLFESVSSSTTSSLLLPPSPSSSGLPHSLLSRSKLKLPKLKPNHRLVTRSACGLDNNDGLPVTPKKLFVQEAIGAEYGEGFETFRQDGLLKIDVDFLNDRLQEGFLQRIRYAMKPDEAYGLVFSWDNVVADTRSIKLNVWKQLAIEEGKEIPEDELAQRLMLYADVDHILHKIRDIPPLSDGLMQWIPLCPCRLPWVSGFPVYNVRNAYILNFELIVWKKRSNGLALTEGLLWETAESEVVRLKLRLSQLYHDNLLGLREPIEGLEEWLDAVSRAHIPCAVVSCLDRINMVGALERMGLKKYFQAIVSEEDGMESIAHRFLSAAMKLDRKPSKCVVFEDDPRAIAAAHNCTMMAVALIGAHPAYDLVQADLAVASFNELSVINLRRLFANKGSTFMDRQKEIVEKSPPKRKLSVDTIY